MLDTANLPTTYQTVAGTVEPSLTAITQFGFGIYNVVAPSGNALNVFVDVVRYGSGIIVTSGATDDITLADIAADDFSGSAGKAYGIIREIQPGVYGVQGDILFGDTGGSSLDWKESDSVVIFEDRVRGAGTNTAFQLSGQHSATGTFRTELGVAVSSGDTESGRSGLTFISANAANQPITFDFSDTDIEDVFLYGCTFTNLQGGTIAFSDDATNGISHHLSGCTFSGCSQIDTGTTVVRNCRFANTADTGGALLWGTNTDIKNSQFLGNTTGEGVEHAAIISVEAFSCDGAGSNTVCTKTGENFLTTIAVNDYAYNETDGSYAKVTSVDSDTQFTTDGLTGGSDNTFTSGDNISVSPAIVYTNLTFSGNTSDVTNSATGSDALFISKSGTSDPSTSTGTVVYISSVPITITVQDKADNSVIQNVQTSVYLSASPYTELMNEDTNASGIATEPYTGSTPVTVVVKTRKSDDLDNPRYFAESSIQTIGTEGLTLTVSMEQNPYI
jgi:hypothetical protein